MEDSAETFVDYTKDCPEYGDILLKIGREAAWMQLAEEAAELSQAASKMARYLHGTNPLGGQSEIDLYANVEEEITDVELCKRVLHLYAYRPDIMHYKLIRWCERLGLIERAKNDR